MAINFRTYYDTCEHRLKYGIGDKIRERFNVRNETSRRTILKRFCPEIYTKFSKLVKVLMDNYGDDFDIQIGELSLVEKVIENRYGNDDEFMIPTKILIKDFNIIIRYPEITITNSNGDSRIIRDLFVKFKLHLNSNRNNISIIKPMGTRTTYTPEERFTGYRHSHLGQGSGNDWSNFCLGSSQPIEIQMMEINNVDWSDETLTMFFLILDRYVRWESIEGRPYYYMSTVGLTTINPVDIPAHQIQEIEDKFTDRLVDNEDIKKCFINSVEWRVVDTDNGTAFELKNLNTVFTKFLREEYSSLDFLFVIKIGVKYYKKDSLQDYIGRLNNKLLFNNQYIYHKIVPDDINNNIDKYRVCNTTLLYNIKHKLESYAKNERLREDLLV